MSTTPFPPEVGHGAHWVSACSPDTPPGSGMAWCITARSKLRNSSEVCRQGDPVHSHLTTTWLSCSGAEPMQKSWGTRADGQAGISYTQARDQSHSQVSLMSTTEAYLPGGILALIWGKHTSPVTPDLSLPGPHLAICVCRAASPHPSSADWRRPWSFQCLAQSPG